MIKYVMAASLALAAAQPAAAAEILDYNVYASGQVQISGGNYGAIAAGTFSNANGKNATNFTSVTSSTAKLDSQADAFSLQLLGMKPTGTLSNSYGALTLTGTGSGVNVFNIDGTTASWANIYALTFAGTGTGAIVNVWGKNLSNYVNLNFGNLAASNVIFNFHQANILRMDGMNVNGTILAPEAFVSLYGGAVAGTVVSDKFHSEGTNIAGTRYAASPQAVPEPSTWAMMLLGFAVIGFAMRRRPRTEADPRIRFDDPIAA